MPARLYCKTGALAGAAFFIDHEAHIGRLRGNEIILPPKVISTHHARIFFDIEEACYFLEDLGSSNGTMLDGIAVTGPTRLEHLHVITLAGQHDFIFQTTPDLAETVPEFPTPDGGKNQSQEEKTLVASSFESAPSLVEAEEALEQTPPEGAFPSVPSLPNQQEDETPLQHSTSSPLDPSPITPRDDESRLSPHASFILEVILPDETHAAFPLKEGVNLVGREQSCDITLADPSISRNHASLTVRAGTVLLKDLGSKNATFVDGKKLTTEVEVHPDTAISFGFGHEVRLKRS